MKQNPLPPDVVIYQSSLGLSSCLLQALLIAGMGFLCFTVVGRESKTKNTDKKPKKKFRPFSSIVSWWKRRNFYVVQDDRLLDDESIAADEHQVLLNDVTTTSSVTSLPSTQFTNDPKVSATLPSLPSFRRNLAEDSLEDSLESMDSLVGSNWDPEDETSEVTTIASNTHQPIDFFVEHLTFLSVQTQPREVELVYDT